MMITSMNLWNFKLTPDADELLHFRLECNEMFSIVVGETDGLNHGCDEIVHEHSTEAADARIR
jgi:hypothetical protein